MAFNFMTAEAKIPLMNIGAEDVFKGNTKIILALFWTLITFYQINSIELDGVNGKEGLMMWVQRQTGPYVSRGLAPVADFHRSWMDGKAFAALMDSKVPELVKYDHLVQLPAAQVMAATFLVGEQEFAVPQILSPEDLLETPKGKKPDEKVVLTYLSMVFYAFATVFKTKNAIKSIEAAVSITRKQRDLTERYATGCKALEAWVVATTERFSRVDEGSFGDTSEAIGLKMGAFFFEHRRVAKPPQKMALEHLTGCHATLDQLCKNNQRHLDDNTTWALKNAPPPRALHAAWQTMEQVELTYEDAIAASFVRFRRVEAVLSAVEVKIAKSNAFLDTAPSKVFKPTGVSKRQEYGASRTEAAALLDSAKLCALQLELHAATPGEARTMVDGADDDDDDDDNKNDSAAARLHAKYADVMEAAQALEARFPAARMQGAMRCALLELTMAEYEKREVVEEVRFWVLDQARVFKARDAAVDTLKLSQVDHLELLVDREFAEEKALYRPKLENVAAHAGPSEDPDATAVVQLQKALGEVRGPLWAAMDQAAKDHRAHLARRHRALRDLLKTKDRYNLVAKAAVDGARDLELFLRAPVFVDSEQDVLNAQAVYVKKTTVVVVDDGSSSEEDRLLLLGSLEAVKALFAGEVTALAKELDEALERGEEDASGAFERFAVEELERELTELDDLSAKYGAELEALLKEEQTKERLRVAFAKACAAARKEVAALALELQGKNQQLLLEEFAGREAELLAFLAAKKLASADAKAKAAAALEPQSAELTALGVLNNQHTSDSVTTIRLAFDALDKALVALVVETEKEQLRREFARACSAARADLKAATLDWKFQEWALKERDLVQALEAKKVELAGLAETHEAKLTPLALELLARGVRTNPHTNDTVATISDAFEAATKEAGVLVEAAEALCSEVARIAGLQGAYVAAASALRKRVEGEVLAVFQRAMTETFAAAGKDAEEVKKSLEEYYAQFRTKLKVELQASHGAVQGQLSEIHEAEHFILHPPFLVSTDAESDLLSREGLENLFSKVDRTDAEYEAALRAYTVRMQQMELALLSTQTRCEQIFMELDELKRMFDGHAYGDNLATTCAFLSYAQQGRAQLETWDSAVGAMEKDLEANKDMYGRHRRFAEVEAMVFSVRSLHGQTLAAAPRYEEALNVSKGEFEKLATLVAPAAWVASVLEAFDEDPWPRHGDFKPSLGEVKAARKAFDLSLEAQLPNVEKAIQAVANASLETERQHGRRGSILTVGSEVEALTASITSLKSVASDRRSALDAEQGRFDEVFEKSRGYAEAATELDQICASTEEALAVEPASAKLGLAAVEADVAAFDEKVAKTLVAKLDAKFAECDALASFLMKSGYNEAFQAFSRFLWPQLISRVKAVKKAVSDHDAELRGAGGLLATEQTYEALRLAFAAEADAYRATLDTAQAEINGALRGNTSLTSQVLGRRMSAMLLGTGFEKPDLGKQLAKVQAIKQDVAANLTLDVPAAKAKELEASQVWLNPHTKDNVFTLRAATKAFEENVKQVESSLIQQIHIEQGRHVTPKQLAEIQEIFASFDLDQDGGLGFREFAQGLTVLGIPMTTDEASAKFQTIKSADRDVVEFDAFVPFMADCLTAPGSSVDDVIQAFSDLARASGEALEDHIPVDYLHHILLDTHADLLTYLDQNMPKGKTKDTKEMYNYLMFSKALFEN